MEEQIVVKEALIEEAVRVSATVVEFDAKFDKKHFESRYQNKNKLIVVAYIKEKPVGFIVGYDKFHDGSFYCWMAGVNPKYRGRGALTALMIYEDNWAKARGYKKIKIKTRNNRREMLAFLVKNGFQFTEITEFPNIDDNRISLEKEL